MVSLAARPGWSVPGAGGDPGFVQSASLRNASHPCHVLFHERFSTRGGCFTRKTPPSRGPPWWHSTPFSSANVTTPSRKVQQRLFASWPVASRPAFPAPPCAAKRGIPSHRKAPRGIPDPSRQRRVNKPLAGQKKAPNSTAYPPQLANHAHGARQNCKQETRNPASTALDGLPCPHPSPSASLPFPRTPTRPPSNDREITPRRCASQGTPANIRGCITNSHMSQIP